jgi:hypothetical protein
MRFIILRRKFSGCFFGVQVICGCYTIQYAFWKFGVYNSNSCIWWPNSGKGPLKEGVYGDK